MPDETPQPATPLPDHTFGFNTSALHAASLFNLQRFGNIYTPRLRQVGE
ncbi:MAG TPA: hypothetical protein VMH80_11890 [Bryobacteraceae bacterium]|nr:hypothetical protein [Bryobacteraceae bacterium]